MEDEGPPLEEYDDDETEVTPPPSPKAKPPEDDKPKAADYLRNFAIPAPPPGKRQKHLLGPKPATTKTQNKPFCNPSQLHAPEITSYQRRACCKLRNFRLRAIC
jgi:hypothetical protein